MLGTTKSGFTLVELLVVIAIIGILANLVMPALNMARDRAIDAKVTSQLVGIRTQSETYYDVSLTYTDVCTNDAKIVQLYQTAMTIVDPVQTAGGLGDGECVSTDTEWAVWVNMRSESAAYCIDRTGSAQQVAIQDSTLVDLTACP